MPTDFMTGPCRSDRYHGFRKTSATEEKSGFLVLLGAGGARQDVRVVVYRTSLEHFAVVYPRKRLSKPTAVVNLRNTSVERAETDGFLVRQNDLDNAVSARFMCSEKEVVSWIAAFESRASTYHQPATLPVLLETEES